MDDRGKLNIPSELYPKGFPHKKENANLAVTLIFKQHKLVAVFSAKKEDNGRMLYPKEENKNNFLLNTVLQKEDLASLVSVIGFNETWRMLSNFIDGVSIKTILKAIRSSSQRLTSRSRYRQKINKFKNKTGKDFIEQFKKIKIITENYMNLDDKVFSDELIRLSYQHIILDSKFLEILKDNAEDQDNTSFVRKIFRQSFDYYNEISNFIIKNFKNNIFLRLYQKIGINFILKNKRVILADEPGVGKTIQIIGAIINDPDVKKSLIICPHISKYGVWREQIKEHVAGIVEDDILILDSRTDLESDKNRLKILKAHFVIVNYELIQSINEKESLLLKHLIDQNFDFMVADEGHALRNNNTISNAMFKLKASKYKVVVTGSPVIGRQPTRIFNLLRWIDPDKFEDKDGKVIDSVKREFFNMFQKYNGFIDVKAFLKKYVLRRMFDDVIIERPNLDIETRKLYMTSKQLEIYKHLMKDFFSLPVERMLQRLDQLKRASVSISLIPEFIFTDIQTKKSYKIGIGSNILKINDKEYQININNHALSRLTPISENAKNDTIFIEKDIVNISGIKYKFTTTYLPETSNKYLETDKIIEDVFNDSNLLEKDKKLVIFTGMRQSLFELQNRYKQKGYDVKILHGSISSKKRRKRIIDEFNNSEYPTIFITTYQTGGVSIDLTGARTAVVLDPPWTYQEFDQLFRRLYRYGQKGNVKIIRLENQGGIDEHIDSLFQESHFIQSMMFGNISDTAINRKDFRKLIIAKLSGNRKSTKQLLSRLKNITRGSLETTPLYINNTIKDNELSIYFYNGEFSAVLQKKDGSIFEILNISKLLQNIWDLDSNSIDLLKNFIISQLGKEKQSDISVKQMLLWKIMTAITPGFENIDYDGQKELMIEAGSYILGEMINNNKIDLDKIRTDLSVISKKMFEKFLIELDESNIFKVFSMIGLINEHFVKDGVIYSYALDYSIDSEYYSGRIYYSDKKKVTTFLGDDNIKSVLNGKREFTEYEEFYLGKQIELGNRYPVELLYKAYEKRCEKGALGANRFIISRNPKFALQGDDIKELSQFAKSHILNLISSYSFNGIWQRMSFKDYFKDRFIKPIISYGFSLAKHVASVTLDQNAYRDNSKVTKQDLIISNDNPLENLEISDTFTSLLINLGFKKVESEIIKTYYLDGILVEELANEFNFSLTKISEIIDRFTSTLDNMGREEIARIIYNDTADNNSDKTIHSSSKVSDISVEITENDIDELLNNYNIWKERISLNPSINELIVYEDNDTYRVKFKILKVKDSKLPEDINTWTFGKDYSWGKNAPLLIAVKESFWKSLSIKAKDMIIFNEIRESYWREILEEQNNIDLTYKDILKYSHILALSEQILSIQKRDISFYNIDISKQIKLEKLFQEKIVNQAFLPEDIIAKTRKLIFFVEKTLNYSDQDFDNAKSYLIQQAIIMIKQYIPQQDEKFIINKDISIAA